MAYFPGTLMIVDDQYDLVHFPEPKDLGLKVQYKALKDIKDFSEKNGIPVIPISKTDDINDIISRIKLYNNVRLLILDLDLNNDGNVEEENDYQMIYQILESAINCYGYFILMINSAHLEAWDLIKKSMPEKISKNLIGNLTYTYNKTSKDTIWDALGTIEKNYSLELVYHFESELNISRDKAFSKFFDFNKSSWEKIFQTLQRETGDMVHNDINNILFGIIKQQMLEVKYPNVSSKDEFHDNEDVRKLVSHSINYSIDKNEVLAKQKVWTGNLYKTDLSADRKYALIINPECDLAQNKNLYYKVVFGFELNEVTFPKSYDNKKYTSEKDYPPLFPFRAGKTKKNTWKSFDDIKNLSKLPVDHMLLLPYASENQKDIIIDFRDVGSFDIFVLKKWKLLLRINDPFITSILDKYCNLINRKGLLPL